MSESEIKEMWGRLESEINRMWDRSDAAESKMAREILCFTIEAAVGGCESRIRETAVAGYVRVMVAPVHLGPRCNGGLDVLHKRPVCGLLLGNAIADC